MRTLSTLIICLAGTAVAQTDTGSFSWRSVGISGGLGVSLVRAVDVVDYINLKYHPPSKIDDFATAAEFYGTLQVHLDDAWGVKAEYAYLLKSYTIPQQFMPDNSFSYGVHMPVVLLQYLILESGYALKIGAGGGYHVASLDENVVGHGRQEYSSKGVGIKIEAEVNTAFDSHLFGTISVDIRDNFMSRFTTFEGRALRIAPGEKELTMNFFSLGVKFGLVYYL